MKITKITPMFLDMYLIVKIETDNGICGIGESGAWGYLEPSGVAIEKFGRYLLGKDPLLIEHHWQYMYRFSHFRGSAIMGAISAIDIALWDIAGQHFETPVYQLLGGKVRDKARAYCHVFGETKADLVKGILDAKNEGFTAVGHLTPFLDEDRSEKYFKTHADKISDAIQTVEMYRDSVGNEVDLCIEIHRRLTPTEAVQLGRGIEQYHPFFYEDPITPDNFDEMAYVAEKINIPIATGERFTSLWEFQMALARNSVQYVRPDVCLVGGISGAKKIASLAEAHHVGVVPHNPLSPVSTAACLQIAASCPNFVLQEYPNGETIPPKSDMVEGLTVHDGRGFLLISEKPGLGIKLKENVEKLCPPVTREVVTRLHEDGSVIDQ
ncbi:MAG: mandelate racemase/muconate lactonizing enzyme family protein [Dehalococcoidia bacterium]|jgi:galactonate dehydratase|nr:galactokinase [Chloroflexota bacterium]MDP7613117.1 mandelate racemase/muconate lactonizing enzyme family protein [Dehalococcoidia bacterium]